MRERSITAKRNKTILLQDISRNGKDIGMTRLYTRATIRITLIIKWHNCKKEGGRDDFYIGELVNNQHYKKPIAEITGKEGIRSLLIAIRKKDIVMTRSSQILNGPRSDYILQNRAKQSLKEWLNKHKDNTDYKLLNEMNIMWRKIN